MDIILFEDAVKVAVYQFGIDEELARNEFEQKILIPSDDYQKGYLKGIEDTVAKMNSMGEKMAMDCFRGFRNG